MKHTKTTWLWCLMAGMAMVSTGCVTTSLNQDPNRSMNVSRTTETIRLDGKLDEPSWQQAKAYDLCHPEDFEKKWLPDVTEFFAKGVVETGQVRLMHDKDYLYIGFDLKDSDLIAEATDDQQMLCVLGDTVEVFLKPVNATHYWEIHLDPLNHTTTFFYRGRGVRGLPSGRPLAKPFPLPGMKTAIALKGTVNQGDNQDQGWSAELAVPLKDLAAKGVAFQDDIPWTILTARYNYSRTLAEKELSAYPLLPFTHFHDHASYAPLNVLK